MIKESKFSVDSHVGKGKAAAEESKFSVGSHVGKGKATAEEKEKRSNFRTRISMDFDPWDHQAP